MSGFAEANKDREIHQLFVPKENCGIIYFIVDDNDKIIYIGSTVNLFARVADHSTRAEFYKKNVFFFLCPLEELLGIESELIYNIKPKYNISYTRSCKGSRAAILLMNRKVAPERVLELRSKIKKSIKQKNISYTKVALMLGVSRQSIYPMLDGGGGTTKKTFKKLENLCLLLENIKTCS